MAVLPSRPRRRLSGECRFHGVDPPTERGRGDEAASKFRLREGRRITHQGPEQLSDRCPFILAILLIIRHASIQARTTDMGS